MTFSYNQQFLMACRKDSLLERITEIHKLLLALPELHYEAIRLLMRHLFVVSTHSAQNKMTTSNLATCFGPTVFRTEQECVSNLYNIKFYSEIVELLICNHERMFEPVLDGAFLGNLIPLKSPPTMISGTMTDLSSVNTSVGNGSFALSPSKYLVNGSSTKLRPAISVVNSNPVNRRGIYEPRNVLMNSTLSSDSSQSDREQQLNSSNNLITTQQITSPISSSSPTHFHNKNESSFQHHNTTQPSLLVNTSNLALNNNDNNSSILNLNKQNQQSPSLNITQQTLATSLPTSKVLTSSTSSSTSSCSLSNQMPPANQNQISISKPYKPFNSQNGQYNPRESLDSSSLIVSGVHKLLNINNENVQQQQPLTRSSMSLSSSNNTAIPEYGINNKNLNSSSPINPRTLNPYSSININMTRSIAPVIITTSMNNINNHNLPVDLLIMDNNNSKTKRARTLYPCEADNPSELSFEANVLITNVRRSKEAGWLEGTYNGKSGLVPGNYVQVLDD
jgi:hypothetical protein